MLIVGADEAVVEADLLASRIACPGCGKGLRPWAYAHTRELRGLGTSEQYRPRRAICRPCGTTHVLLGEHSLSRRRDRVEVIGFALLEKAGGMGRRSIAALLGRHEATVASWLRRFDERSEQLRQHFTAWAGVLDFAHDAIAPRRSAFLDALEVIGVVARLAVRRFGPRAPFVLASVLTEGGLLATRAHPYRVPI